VRFSACAELSKVIFLLYAQDVLYQLLVAVRVTCPAVEVVTFDEEENFVASDQLVCPEPPDQSVCVQGLDAA